MSPKPARHSPPPAGSRRQTRRGEFGTPDRGSPRTDPFDPCAPRPEISFEIGAISSVIISMKASILVVGGRLCPFPSSCFFRQRGLRLTNRVRSLTVAREFSLTAPAVDFSTFLVFDYPPRDVFERHRLRERPQYLVRASHSRCFRSRKSGSDALLQQSKGIALVLCTRRYESLGCPRISCKGPLQRENRRDCF